LGFINIPALFTYQAERVGFEMVEKISKSNIADPLSLFFELQMTAFQMQAIWLSLLLGDSSYSNFIGEYKKVLENCQSRGIQRNRRSYDQLDFLPTLYLDAFNAAFKSREPKMK
jgi:hypothetical protein